MLKRLVIVATLVGTMHAHAECWVVGDLSGQSAMVYEGYKISPDSLKKQTFQINLAGSGSSLTPNNGMSCIGASPSVLSCMSRSGDAVTLETWAVDPKARTVYYTKVRSGYGSVDGAALFVGVIHGPCK